MSTKNCLHSKKHCRHKQKTNMNILLVPEGNSNKAKQQTFLYYWSFQQSRKSCVKTLRYIEQQRNAEWLAVAHMKTNLRYASPFLCSSKILTKQLYTGRNSLYYPPHPRSHDVAFNRAIWMLNLACWVKWIVAYSINRHWIVCQFIGPLHIWNRKT